MASGKEELNMMKDTAIQKYVDNINLWRDMMGKKTLSLHNQNDYRMISDILEGDMSPENLTCDGELRGAQVQQKLSYYTRCAKELKNMAVIF